MNDRIKKISRNLSDLLDMKKNDTLSYLGFYARASAYIEDLKQIVDDENEN